MAGVIFRYVYMKEGVVKTSDGVGPFTGSPYIWTHVGGREIIKHRPPFRGHDLYDGNMMILWSAPIGLKGNDEFHQNQSSLAWRNASYRTHQYQVLSNYIEKHWMKGTFVCNLHNADSTRRKIFDLMDIIILASVMCVKLQFCYGKHTVANPYVIGDLVGLWDSCVRDM